MLIPLTLNCMARIHFCADLVTLGNGQKSPGWCTFVVLMGGYNQTKLEEAGCHSLWKSPNFKVSGKFQRTSIISPWMPIRQTKSGIGDIQLMYFMYIPSFIWMTCTVPEIMKLPILHMCWPCDLDKQCFPWRTVARQLRTKRPKWRRDFDSVRHHDAHVLFFGMARFGCPHNFGREE